MCREKISWGMVAFWDGLSTSHIGSHDSLRHTRWFRTMLLGQQNVKQVTILPSCAKKLEERKTPQAFKRGSILTLHEKIAMMITFLLRTRVIMPIYGSQTALESEYVKIIYMYLSQALAYSRGVGTSLMYVY